MRMRMMGEMMGLMMRGVTNVNAKSHLECLVGLGWEKKIWIDHKVHKVLGWVVCILSLMYPVVMLSLRMHRSPLPPPPWKMKFARLVFRC